MFVIGAKFLAIAVRVGTFPISNSTLARGGCWLIVWLSVVRRHSTKHASHHRPDKYVWKNKQTRRTQHGNAWLDSLVYNLAQYTKLARARARAPTSSQRRAFRRFLCKQPPFIKYQFPAAAPLCGFGDAATAMIKQYAPLNNNKKSAAQCVRMTSSRFEWAVRDPFTRIWTCLTRARARRVCVCVKQCPSARLTQPTLLRPDGAKARG